MTKFQTQENFVRELPLPKRDGSRIFPLVRICQKMEVFRNRMNRPERLRLVKRRLEIARPGTMRRRYDKKAQRKV